MTGPEMRTLERLFVAVGELRDRMDDRFDTQDERLRKVEEYVISQSSASSTRAEGLAIAQKGRDERTITKRWVVGVLLAFGTILTGVIGVIVRLIQGQA